MPYHPFLLRPLPCPNPLQFLKACEKWGRDDLEHICAEIESKTPEAVRAYAKAFWKRYTEIPNYETMIRARPQHACADVYRAN